MGHSDMQHGDMRCGHIATFQYPVALQEVNHWDREFYYEELEKGKTLLIGDSHRQCESEGLPDCQGGDVHRLAGSE